MAGSLKVTCTAGQQAYAYTTAATLATLNAATAWTISFFYELVSWDTGANGDLIQIGNPPFKAITSGGNIQIFAQNAANTKTIGKTVGLDTAGHHILLSGSESGTSVICIDGIQNATTAALGALVGTNGACFFGWDDPVHAATLYLRDVAVWGSYSASAADALALAEGTKTPATLATPATNYWTLQGTPGAVTAGIEGLADAIGSVPLNGVFGSGVLTYDAHEIVSVPAVPVSFMTPYVTTPGYVLYVPFYLNATITAGGPILPDSIFTDPVFTVEGSTVVPTRLPLDVLCAFVAYQFATAVTIGQAVTMAAAPGWAITSAGIVGGTSAAGLGSAPMACLNYAGTARDNAVVATTFKPGYSLGGSGDRESQCQIMANWARRLVSLDPGEPSDNNWRGTGTITSFDANNLPAAFTGGAGANLLGYIYKQASGNGADAEGVPGFFGTLTLIHGDATPGVTSDPSTGHVLQLDLVTFSVGWTVEAATIENAGEWDAGTSTWHKIIKTYRLTWSSSGGFLTPNILLQIARVDGLGGAVVIPILANGQSELGVFEPSVADPAVPATIPSNYLDLFDPLAVAPSFLARHAGAHAVRWMQNQILSTTTGNADLVYPADLNIRKSTDFLATNSTTTTLDVTRVDPVSLSVATQIIVDYLNGDDTGTLPIAITPTRSFSIFALITTASPHGLRTGDKALSSHADTVRSAASDSAYITITSNIDAVQTVIPVSVVTGINGDSSSFLFAGYILQIGSATTDEQVEIVSISGLDLTVNRAARGTTALAKTSGTVVYPCRDLLYGGINDVVFPTSPTQFLAFLFSRAVPGNAPRSSTLLNAQTYSHGACPLFIKILPFRRGTSSYELCSRATSLIAAAKTSGECICWVNIPMFATDAAVTAIVNTMTADFTATPGMTLVVQVSNEVFNGGFDTHVYADTLSGVAPNPQSGGTGFDGFYDYWASRQHTFNLLARAAFTAAGLDPDRVVWYHNGTNQGTIAQPIMAATIAFCQRYSLPVRSISTNCYADMSASMAATYVSVLPALTGVTGATATWSLATARKWMMANYRASMRHGITLAITYVDATKYLSRYNNGISVDGSAPANTNTVHGRLCFYEGSTTQIIPWPNDAFPEHAAWTMAMQYDPEWYQTEWAYFQALQDMPYQYALLMGSKFPDPTDAAMEFGCYFFAVGPMGPASPTQGYSYPAYRWQQQKAGYGDGTAGGVMNRLDSWTASGGIVTAVNRDMTANGGVLPPTINESVRGQVALDWIAASGGGDSVGALTVTEHHDSGAALSQDSVAGLSVRGRSDVVTTGMAVGGGILRGVKRWMPGRTEATRVLRTGT